MVPGGGKVKGKSFENKVAKNIQKYLFDNSDKYRELCKLVNNEATFVKRDSSSGTFKDSDGDIHLGLAKEYYPYSIECKFHADLDLTISQMFKKVPKLIKIWNDQVLVTSKRVELFPLLIFKSNRTKDFCMFDVTKIPFDYRFCKFGPNFMFDNFIICLFDDFNREHCLNYKV